MDKIAYIDEYIGRCNDIIGKKDINAAEVLEDEILAVFSSEISDIVHKLDAYNYHSEFEIINYLGDIKILKQKLLNYKYNLQSEKDKMAYNLEIARLSQPTIMAHAESNQSQSQASNTSINISIEHTIKQIDEISADKLNVDDKEKLKDYLYILEGIKSSKDKNKYWDKTKEVLKFLADKGADAAIAMLPYIIKGLSA